MSRWLGKPERDEIEKLPVGTIQRRLAYALFRRLGEWISTEDLMDVAYDYDEGSKEALKLSIHALRKRLSGYVIEGTNHQGRRMRRIET